MNPSYGDSTNSAHGRARVPGSDGGHDGHAEGVYQPYDAYDPYRADPYGADPYADAAYQAPPPVPASHPVKGRASVPVSPVSPTGGAATGRATVGRASVRPPDGTGPGGP